MVWLRQAHDRSAGLRRCAGLGAAQKHNFTASQFAIFHPGGSLGRKLLLTVGNIMHKGEENPTVLADTKVQDALFVITDKGLGAVSVVDADGVMQGVLTDGDIRRGLSKGVDFLQRPVCELMTKSPKTITEDKLAARLCILWKATSRNRLQYCLLLTKTIRLSACCI